MKKTFLLRGLVAACLIVACAFSASAAVLLTEDFDYTVGNRLGVDVEDVTMLPSSVWCSYSGTKDFILVVDDNLTCAGYSDLATSKAVALPKNGGDDLYSFSAITSGDVYLSALVKIVAPKNSTTADYFLSFGEANTSSLNARLYAKSNADKTKLTLGVSKNTDAAVYTTEEYAVGDVVLVVLKYSIVDGEKNDVVSLYINPTSDTTNPTLTCDATAAAGKNDANKIASVNLRQGTNTPNVIVDAIRVADTWADLFPAAGSGGGDDETETTPMLECGVLLDGELTPYAMLEGAMVGEEITCTLHIAGKDLKGDITLAADHADILSFDPATVAQADAEAGGKDVIVTIKPSSSIFTTYTITASSEGAEDFPISIYCMAQQPPYQNLQAFIDAFAGEESSYFDYTVKSDMVVTHVFDQNGISCAYIQDATAGVRVYDNYGSMQSYKTGDRIKELIGTLELSYGVYSINTTNAPDNPAVIKNEPAEPTLIGIGDMINYVGRLVRINNVAIATTNNKTTITASDATAELTTFSGSDVEIATLPAEADIIGIVRSANATVRRISPRSKVDIISRVASDLDNITTSQIWAADGALHIQGADAMQVEVLNVAGQTILIEAFAAGTHSIALDGGVYLVKVNGAVAKIIIR